MLWLHCCKPRKLVGREECLPITRLDALSNKRTLSYFCLCLILITQDVAQPILVCSAHIHWDPEFCDVKLIQSMMLMEQLRQIMENFGHSFRPGHKKAGPESVQLLLCADFNSLPQSGVIEFIKNGRVPTNHPDLKVKNTLEMRQKVQCFTAGYWVC